MFTINHQVCTFKGKNRDGILDFFFFHIKNCKPGIDAFKLFNFLFCFVSERTTRIFNEGQTSCGETLGSQKENENLHLCPIFFFYNFKSNNAQHTIRIVCLN